MRTDIVSSVSHKKERKDWLWKKKKGGTTTTTHAVCSGSSIYVKKRERIKQSSFFKQKKTNTIPWDRFFTLRVSSSAARDSVHVRAFQCPTFAVPWPIRLCVGRVCRAPVVDPRISPADAPPGRPGETAYPPRAAASGIPQEDGPWWRPLSPAADNTAWEELAVALQGKKSQINFLLPSEKNWRKKKRTNAAWDRVEVRKKPGKEPINQSIHPSINNQSNNKSINRSPYFEILGANTAPENRSRTVTFYVILDKFFLFTQQF